MKILLTLFILFVLAFTTAAQDATGTPEAPAAEPSPFLRTLSLIADVPPVQAGGPVVSYGANHEALLARGLPVPPSWAIYEALGTQTVFLFSIPGTGMSNFITTLLLAGAKYPDTVGFDFFQIKQAVEVGRPPEHGQVLLGAFDPESVIAAHTARGYTIESESDAGTLLCPADGCDSGAKTRISERDPANPFGGDLGQMRPLFVADGVIVVATNFDVLQGLIAPLTADAPTLADLPEYQAVANTLAAYPLVPAVMVFNPADLQPDGAADEEAQAIVDANPLPPYELVAIASAADADAGTENGLALFVYADAAAAGTAAASLDARMALSSALAGASFGEMFGEAGTLEPARVVTDEATGLSVVVLQISAARPSNERVDGSIVMSHRPFNRFLRSIITRDSLWLATDTSQ